MRKAALGRTRQTRFKINSQSRAKIILKLNLSFLKRLVGLLLWDAQCFALGGFGAGLRVGFVAPAPNS